MKSNVETCPACGKPMTPGHRLVLLIPVIVWNGASGLFERQWNHNTNPSLN